MAGHEKKLISILIPVLNEHDNVERAYHGICEQFEKGLGENYDFEIIFSDNHSTDGTEVKLIELAERDKRIKVLRLARNFGFERSLLTAFRAARGDAAIQIDCDLQDPPSLIATFIKHWELGHDIVVGIRVSRKEPILLRVARKSYYRLVTKTTPDLNILENAGDFRLVDKSIVDRLRLINDLHPYMRGLTSSMSSNQIGIPYERDVRTAGSSKFPVSKLFGFATNGLVSNSMVPLRLATFTGMLAFVISAIVALYYAATWLLIGQNWPEGFATTTLLLVSGIGLNGIFIGIVGEYVGRIYEQVRTRPITVVEWTVNLEDPVITNQLKGAKGQVYL